VVIVRSGRISVESRLGRLHVDRPLDAAQVELVVAAIEAVGWDCRHVTEVELTDGCTRVHRIKYNGDGRPLMTDGGVTHEWREV